MIAATQTSTIWISVVAGALSGLTASIVGQILLGDRPWAQVKAFHDVHRDRTSGEPVVTSYVKVANVRGRPMRIEGVVILQPEKLSTDLPGILGLWGRRDGPSDDQLTRLRGPGSSSEG